MPETITDYPPAADMQTNAFRAVDGMRELPASVPEAVLLAFLKLQRNVSGAGLVVNEISTVRTRIREQVQAELEGFLDNGEDLASAALRTEHSLGAIVEGAVLSFWMGCFAGPEMIGSRVRTGLAEHDSRMLGRSLRPTFFAFARDTLHESAAARSESDQVYPPTTFASAELTYAWARFLRSLMPAERFNRNYSYHSYAENQLVERSYQLSGFYAALTSGLALCECGAVDNEDDGVHVHGNWVCGSCSGDTEDCSSCSTTFWREDLLTDPDEDYICEICHTENVGNCDDCGAEYWVERRHCDACGWRPYDDDGNGGSGEYGPMFVNYYSYKPEPRFHFMYGGALRTAWSPAVHDEDRIFMGVELETNCPGGRSNRQRGGKAIYDAAIMQEHGFIYAKSDCTVSGPEIVSHPATLDAHRFLWKTFPFRELAVEHGWTGWRGGNAGIHIHIARTAFNGTSHIARFQMFFGGWRDEMISFCGRNDSSYGYHGSEMQGGAVSYAKRDRLPPRGSAINHEPQNTVEVRMFRSSLRPTTLAAYLELMHALVTYTGIKRSNNILSENAADFWEFLVWMENNGNYTHAVNRIAERSN